AAEVRAAVRVQRPERVGGDARLRVDRSCRDGEGAAARRAEVERARAVVVGVRRQAAERERRGRRGGGVDLSDAADAGRALVADVVRKLLAVLVAVPAEDVRVVSAGEGDRRPAAREGAAGAVAEADRVALDGERGCLRARDAARSEEHTSELQ